MRGFPHKVTHFVPHLAIRIERQAANGNSRNEIARGSEKPLHQNGIARKEQDVPHQTAHGFCGRNLVDAIFGTLLQEKQARDWGAAVLTWRS
jgi:hypothetical protein